jgi:hypothetical protein
MPEFGETPKDIPIRGITKGIQESGLPIHLDPSQGFTVKAPEGSNISPQKLSQLQEFINQAAREPNKNLLQVTPASASKVADALHRLAEKEGYTEDLVHYGPAIVGTVEDRMKRLANARRLITETQQQTLRGDWKDKPGIIKAAIFARSHLPDLGVLIIINTLRAIGSHK